MLARTFGAINLVRRAWIFWTLGPGVNSPLSVERNDFLSTESPLPAGAEAGSRLLLGRLLGGDEMDKATGERAHQTKTPWRGV